MKKLTNEVMLITYADSLGKNLKELDQVLSNELDGVVGGVHVLPFFPSTGDRGFAPEEYETVDPKFGDWSDIDKLAEKYYLMFDFMLNHISPQSKYFQDFLEKKEDSEYYDMFLKYSEFWPENRPTAEDIDLIYKRKDKAPFAPVTFADGTTDQVWNTFGDQQMDLDVIKPVTKQFIKDSLINLARHGASVIRLDAFAYAIKKLDTNDFFVEPEIWDVLNEVREILAAEGSEVLPEIHEHYKIVRKITDHDMYSYDFALPLITLYSLYSGKTNRLADWLRQSPMKQFTTLDTHDGIGVVDAKDLLTQEETDFTTEEMYKVGANVKKIFSSAAYNNLDIYQINTTYYSALGNDDAAYLLARATQIFAPGIPQVYYVGLLAGENDLELLESTKEGRNINRHYYDLEEIAETVKRPVVSNLFDLLRFRNTSPAFDLDGEIKVENNGDNDLTITRTSADGQTTAILTADFATKQFKVTENDKEIFNTQA